MATLKNESKRARGIPVGHGKSVVLAAGESAEITEAQALNVSKNRMAKSWLAHGLISIESDTQDESGEDDDKGGAEGASDTAEQSDPADRKASLIARLAEFGITKDKRSSVESLESALAEALSEAADTGEEDAANG